MGDDRPIGELENRQLRVTGRPAQLLARALAQERDRAAVGGDHLLVLDSRGTERLLHPSTWMNSRATVITVADEQRWGLGHLGPPLGAQAGRPVLSRSSS